MQDIAIKVQHVNKVYKLYEKPMDRLKEALNFSKVKRHREHYALDNISLEVERGETLGIIGTNGSGKSTLLKILTGVLTQTSGEVEIDGKISALLELGAGFNMEYTGIENIYLNGSISGYTKADMDKKLDKIIDFADIGEFIHQPVKTYSSGMFVRLAFAVAINIEPDILIVDEALSVGDNIFQSKCYNKFKEFKEQGKTILMVTHDVDSVRRFCDRCVWIEQGKLRKVGDVNKITSEYMAYTSSTTKIEKKETTNKLKNNETTNEIIIKEKVFDAISRWGSMPNLIKHVGLINEKNEEIEYLSKNMNFKLVIDVKIDSAIIEDNFAGVAFAIKNKKGQDLIVGDTFGENNIFKQEGIYRVSFEMNNYLVPGEYYIVASLEKRETQIPSYIDYIEGAHYFKVGSEKTYYGMIDVPIAVKSELI